MNLSTKKRCENQLLNLWNSNPTCKLKSPKTQKNKSAGAKVTRSSITKDIKSDVIILIDSNKKFLDKNKLFLKEKVYIVACPTIEKGYEILQQTKFIENHTIIIHTGVNNIETQSAEEVSGKFCELLSSFKTAYPTTKIIASGITPRKDKFNIAVRTANQLLRTELEKEELLKNISFIDNSNLDKEEFLYNDKRLDKNSGVKILASNIKNSVQPKPKKPFNKQSFDAPRYKSNGKETDAPPAKRNSVDTNNVMSDVLEQLKQMNNFLISAYPPKPRQLPPPGPWLGNAFPSPAPTNAVLSPLSIRHFVHTNTRY